MVAPLHWRTTNGRVSALDGLGEHLPDLRAGRIYRQIIWSSTVRRFCAEFLLALQLAQADDGGFYGALAEEHIMRHGPGRPYGTLQADGSSSFKPLHTPMPLTVDRNLRGTKCTVCGSWQSGGKHRFWAGTEDARTDLRCALASDSRGDSGETIAFNREFLIDGERPMQYQGAAARTVANAVALHLDLVPAGMRAVGAVVKPTWLSEDIRVRQRFNAASDDDRHASVTAALENQRCGALPWTPSGGAMAELMAQTRTISELGRADRQGRDDGRLGSCRGTATRSKRVEPEHEDVLQHGGLLLSDPPLIRLAGISPTSPGYTLTASPIRPPIQYAWSAG